jgi:hypothetical protein
MVVVVAVELQRLADLWLVLVVEQEQLVLLELLVQLDLPILEVGVEAEVEVVVLVEQAVQASLSSDTHPIYPKQQAQQAHLQHTLQGRIVYTSSTPLAQSHSEVNNG